MDWQWLRWLPNQFAHLPRPLRWWFVSAFFVIALGVGFVYLVGFTVDGDASLAQSGNVAKLATIIVVGIYLLTIIVFAMVWFLCRFGDDLSRDD